MKRQSFDEWVQEGHVVAKRGRLLCLRDQIKSFEKKRPFPDPVSTASSHNDDDESSRSDSTLTSTSSTSTSCGFRSAGTGRLKRRRLVVVLEGMDAVLEHHRTETELPGVIEERAEDEQGTVKGDDAGTAGDGADKERDDAGGIVHDVGSKGDNASEPVNPVDGVAAQPHSSSRRMITPTALSRSTNVPDRRCPEIVTPSSPVAADPANSSAKRQDDAASIASSNRSEPQLLWVDHATHAMLRLHDVCFAGHDEETEELVTSEEALPLSQGCQNLMLAEALHGGQVDSDVEDQDGENHVHWVIECRISFLVLSALLVMLHVINFRLLDDPWNLMPRAIPEPTPASETFVGEFLRLVWYP